MNHFNLPPSEKRSAVVVTQDGEVQECVDTENPGANEINFSPLDETASDSKLNYTEYRHYSPIGLLFKSIILIGTVIGFIYFSFPMQLIPEIPFVVSSKNVSGIKNENENEIQNPIEKLKRIATFVIQDNQLNISHIESFFDEWNRLNESVKEDFLTSFWFTRFSSLLDDKIGVAKVSEQLDPENANGYLSYLIKMASLTRAEKVETEIADVEKAIKSTSNIADNENVSDSPGIDEDFAEIFKAITINIAKTEIEKKKTLESNIKVLDKKIARTNTQGFTESDINYLLGKYTSTYEFGNTNRIMDYFSVNKSYKRRLIRSFNKVFSKT